jgi:hypothetical protein
MGSERPAFVRDIMDLTETNTVHSPEIDIYSAAIVRPSNEINIRGIQPDFPIV